jgi:hypothetical protein
VWGPAVKQNIWKQGDGLLGTRLAWEASPWNTNGTSDKKVNGSLPTTFNILNKPDIQGLFQITENEFHYSYV